MEVDRKWVHNNLCNEQESATRQVNTSIVLPHSQLSTEQLFAHDLVLKSLHDGVCIKLIVCGGAGTGKSTFINAVVCSVLEYFGKDKSVRIMAPTGVAAFNIGGATIHHELAIQSDRSSTGSYMPIIGDQCQRMQEDYTDTKLIIIDEYSMLGRKMLANIDGRCRDIFAKDDPFGNVSIVLVGDIRQLPPVCDSPLYAESGGHMLQLGAIAYAGFDKCVRLSRIFRQAGDAEASFRDALLRLSNGTSNFDDWHLFRSRDYSILSSDDKTNFKYALRLFPTKQSANEYNRSRLIELGRPIARVNAKHNCDVSSKASSDDAKGLESVLCVSVGARVMLRSNLATKYGLVNGAMGTVVDIVYGSQCTSPVDIPLAIMVDFDNYNGLKYREESNIIPIAQQTSNWKSANGVSCQRTQLPIVLCWAITIHKSQGLTLDKVVVDIGEKESLGLTFVALSRTRKLCDLAFNPMFSFDRLQKIGKCSGLTSRLKEEERLQLLSSITRSS